MNSSKIPLQPQADRDPETGQFLPGNTTGPRWLSGQSGNPGGSRTAGAWVMEWLNVLVKRCEEGELDEAALLEIRQDTRQSWAKRTAAKLLINVLHEDESAEGKLDPGKDLDRIMDRTQGRAVQRAEVHIDTPRAPDDLLTEARRAAGMDVVGGEG